MKNLSLIFILAISQGAFGSNAPLLFDPGINDLLLEDSESGKQFLLCEFPTCGAPIDFGYCFTNNEGTEILALYAHPGDVKYSIAEIRVSLSLLEANLPKFPGSGDKFRSVKGIRLGISPEELEKIIGKPAYAEKGVYRYRIENDEYLLKTYNLPIYYGDYKFKDGKLIEFKYGFEYP